MNRYPHLYYFSIFILISFWYILNDSSIFAVNDDLALLSLLKQEKFYSTLILSYPSSYVLHYLYNVSNIQWYSLFITSTIFLNLYLISLHIAKLRKIYHKILFFLFIVLILSYLWTHISITSLTLFTLFTAIFIGRDDIIKFSILLLFASLLRTGITINLFPFILIAYLIVAPKILINRRKFLILLIIWFAIFLNISLTSLDIQDAEWHSFNSARAHLHDFKGEPKKNTLSKEQMILIHDWWVQDEKLLPAQQVISSSPSLAHIALKQLKVLNMSHILNHNYKYFILFLMLITLFLALSNLHNKKFILYLLFLVGFILLLQIRDKDRVTILLMMIWALIIFLDIQKRYFLSSLFLSITLILLLYYLYTMPRIIHYPNTLKNEAIKLIQKSELIVEASITFPTFWGTTQLLFGNNILFNEHDWLTFGKHSILPSGWLSRHSFFYDTHNINPNGYKTFYEFLLSDKTGFIGTHVMNTSKEAKSILNMYDQHYLENTSCHHTFTTIQKSKHFTITKMQVICK